MTFSEAVVVWHIISSQEMDTPSLNTSYSTQIHSNFTATCDKLPFVSGKYMQGDNASPNTTKWNLKKYWLSTKISACRNFLTKCTHIIKSQTMNQWEEVNKEMELTSWKALYWLPHASEAPTLFTGRVGAAEGAETTVSCLTTRGPVKASTALWAIALPLPKAIPVIK